MISREQVENRVLGVGRVLWLAFIVVICVVPLLYMLLLSVRPLQAVLSDPLDFIPSLEELNLEAYRKVIASPSEGGYGLLSFFRNSLIVAIGSVLLTVLFSVLGAYAATRLRFPGKNVINTSFFAVYMFPGIVMAIPLFVLFSRMGLRGELGALVIIYLASTVPVCVYMLRNYFRSIPEGLEDAAMVDGCNRGQVITRIVLPLAMPSIAATSLYVFMIAWNEYLFALLFLLERRDNWTVSLGLAQLDDISVSETVLMAGSVLLTLPVIALFFVAERLLVEGLTAGAEKG
ncbi:carbohydrate ABC transporter permease [Phytoactinopolyspora halotolerans]|uniref:Carbohydrate ABC transporter permease n=1 Tax=Phytoactinopolyspora halotolerans TaxID=1981512 RepID=A0A6L9S9Q8_9ACTN|nr:carbohydrate ABC transporter permease [Phytoactinopolyspora halotolerans]NEE01258.1 carbohydrate ABC transporter permease [Phytoactinopolyspora halotolerans]